MIAPTPEDQRIILGLMRRINYSIMPTWETAAERAEFLDFQKMKTCELIKVQAVRDRRRHQIGGMS